ncbi:MAG: sigma-70 family RNA polymerase sigma factor [Planctomycetota bacterium]
MSRTTHLLARWRAGDDDALDQLMRRHLPRIRGMVRRRLGGVLRRKAELDDYVEEAVVEFLQYGQRVTINNGRAFRQFMVAVVRCVLFDSYRWWKAKRRDLARETGLPQDAILELGNGTASQPAKVASRGESIEWARLGLEFVRDKEKRILMMRVHEGLSYRDIAARLGITEHAACKRYQRAVEALGVAIHKVRRGDLFRPRDDQAGDDEAPL